MREILKDLRRSLTTGLYWIGQSVMSRLRRRHVQPEEYVVIFMVVADERPVHFATREQIAFVAEMLGHCNAGPATKQDPHLT